MPCLCILNGVMSQLIQDILIWGRNILQLLACDVPGCPPSCDHSSVASSKKERRDHACQVKGVTFLQLANF